MHINTSHMMHNMKPECFILDETFTSFNFSCSFNRIGEYRRVENAVTHALQPLSIFCATL